MTRRWALWIEYDGGPFRGWQRQTNGPSVQQALEEAVFRFSGERVTAQGAGRTDTGVHALGQVAHIDLAKPVDGNRIREALNFHLRPDPVVVVRVEAAPHGFDARRSAVGRAYLYRILVRRAPPALDRGRVWHVPSGLDAAAMHAAAQALVGHHDFTSFRAAECQAASPHKTLDRLDVSLRGDEIHVTAQARSFLHHQVRAMVGTLERVGQGKWTRRQVAAALAARDRSAAGPTAPAAGLYLTGIRYPEF